MNIDHHFLEPKKLIKLTNKKYDKEVIKNLQLLSEKFIMDIINRSSFLCKHKGKNILDVEEVAFVAEKDFDYCFGVREINYIKHTGTNEHIEKMAEISRQNK
ncbi:transcription initiation factor tfiid subunit taf12-like protein [Vairimorpha apis BRL 01]|uniref:Transcription initiation factor tfiid subunit taf12-like protein n=1 Tax=Vairimorpha apis BRL 01 TaxID=1037528 RepID=T0LDA3_9MICR|nr:transcription initiation factor tfiid subunit taf12-like protein [Vairimorpha apis BRL 01]